MGNNQDEIRAQVKRRCTPQKQVAKDVGVTNIYFNVWLKGKRNLSEVTLEKVKTWLVK